MKKYLLLLALLCPLVTRAADLVLSWQATGQPALVQKSMDFKTWSDELFTSLNSVQIHSPESAAFFRVMSDRTTLNLVWNASPSDGVTGYVLYYGTSPGSFSTRLEVGNQLTASVSGLEPAMSYYFAVTAVDADGNESDPSNIFPSVPQPILNLQIANEQ